MPSTILFTSHDGAAIRQLANTASLADLPFLPCAGRFLLTFPLEDAVDGRWRLVQVPRCCTGTTGNL
ncbi:MAG: hypothetical protein ACLUE8_08245 [Lachnospiraceae bacterium]